MKQANSSVFRQITFDKYILCQIIFYALFYSMDRTLIESNLPLVFQVNANASLTMSLAQTSYCKKQGYDPQNPLCAHVIFYGVVEKVNQYLCW